MCQYTILLILLGLIILFLMGYDLNYNTREKFIIESENISMINSNPIKFIDGFLSLSECDQLIDLANSRYITSTVYLTNSGTVDVTARSSSCAYFKRCENDLLKSIELKVGQMFSIDPTQIEPLQIVKYEKGQQYKYHYDYFANNTDQVNNQRVYSILVYLNDLDELDGGSTHFPLYKIRTYPYKSRAICWNNLNLDGTENSLTLHAGEPILTDKTKYVLTIWTRQKPY